MNTDEAQHIYKTCARFLTHHYPRTPQQILRELAETTGPDMEADRYGQGEVINRFEAEVASLLGKEAAVFMPSGTMCQQIALRIWSNRRGTPNIVFHPKSHLENHEQKAYEHLHALHGILAGSPDRLLTLEDLNAVVLHGEYEKLQAASLEIAKETGVRLFFWLAPTSLPSYQKFELVVGDATLDLTNNEIVDLFQMLFEKAGMEMGERSNISLR
jgi:hypothetical protein